MPDSRPLGRPSSASPGALTPRAGLRGSRWRRFALAASSLLLSCVYACSTESSTSSPSSAAGGSAGSGGSMTSGGGVSTSGGNAAGGRASGGAAGPSSSGGAGLGGASGGISGTSGSPATNGGSDASSGGSSNAAGAPTGGSVSAGGSGSSGAPADPSAELYDPELLPRFDLEVSDAAMEALDEDGDTYVEAELRYGSESVGRVGLRIKGEGSRRTLRQKTAFKLKFDEFVDDQTFRGLRRLTLNNMVEDPSFLAERLAYHVFRAARLPAPRCNSALLYVNGDFFGVYANVEAEDKTFLRRWFASDEGNLYEEGQVDFVPGAEAMFNLETNETENDRSDLANLIAVFQAASPQTFLEDLDAALDTEHFLRFTAAEAAVNQWDMYAYTMFYPNNFRIYHDPATSRFVFLPWGMDMSMKPFRDSDRQHLEVFGLTRRGDRESQPITSGLIFRRCLESTTCCARYAEVVAEIVEVYETADLEALAERYKAQITPHVEADPRKEYTLAEFERGYEALVRTIRERPGAMRAEL